MHCELFCVCKSAVVHKDRSMTLERISEHLEARRSSLPLSDIVVVARLRFDRIQKGKHIANLLICDPRGQTIARLQQRVAVRATESPFYATILFRIDDFSPPETGVYLLALEVGRQRQSVLALRVEIL
jgi:hypothetical protein